MATKTYTDYKKEAEEASKALKEEDIKLANDQAAENERLINENYETQLAETREDYEDLFRKNEVQKVLNERYFDRKAAEMGLSDSGFSRTRQTANQLNYANTNAEYEKNKQKAEDTLAAAMRAKITENELNRRQNVQSIESSYDTAASKTASDNYKAYVESIADSETDADKEYDKLYNTIYKEFNNNNRDANNVLFDEKVISPTHARLIIEYQLKNGLELDSTQMQRLISASGLSRGEYLAEYNNYLNELAGTEAVEEAKKAGTLKPTETQKAKKVASEVRDWINYKPAEDASWWEKALYGIHAVNKKAGGQLWDDNLLKKIDALVEQYGLSESEHLAVLDEFGFLG